jgi:hypothetical protein
MASVSAETIFHCLPFWAHMLGNFNKVTSGAERLTKACVGTHVRAQASHATRGARGHLFQRNLQDGHQDEEVNCNSQANYGPGLPIGRVWCFIALRRSLWSFDCGKRGQRQGRTGKEKHALSTFMK